MDEEKQEYQLVTIDEMRELVKSKTYNIPEGDEKYPLELRKDEETGNLYTDYFVDFKDDILISHLLVEQLFASFEEVDWNYVTNNFDPHIIARICSLYRYPLTWMDIPDEWKGKVIVEGRLCREKYLPAREDVNIGYFSVDLVTSERALYFANELPDFYVGENEEFLLHKTIHDWRIFLADFGDIDYYAPNPEDPYFKEEAFPIFKRETFIANLTIVRDELGAKKALEIIQLLRDEWKYICKLHLFGYEDNDEDAKDFEHFLFEELDLYIEGWTAESKEDLEKQDERESVDYTSCIFTKKAKQEERQKIIIACLKDSMVGAPDKARALVKEIQAWQKDGYLDMNYKASTFYKELAKFFPLPFSYDGFRKYFYE